MSYGYTGNILHVDLTNRNIEIEEKDDTFYRSYLGGRGIGYHYLMKLVPPGVDPFSPDNILVLATGVEKMNDGKRRIPTIVLGDGSVLSVTQISAARTPSPRYE